MSDLTRVAKLQTLTPIGIKYKNSTGTYVKVPFDKTDNYLDASLSFLTADSAKSVIQSQIDTLDTNDKIEDATISDKITTLTNALQADNK
ncbi:hypothetical protein RF371_11500 [Companilactobacillus paralimentarius]|uniref:Uncharacterized protein n=2 Tax=Companilactobacillus TaxID=2767879 RepID=A0A0R1KK61_9LACO|nr:MULTISPECIES: hypothetical protein [Companilactobacillus]KRK80378.1 hypothetical protein FD03_GL001797 [Companilactobacillus nodensis DSM 19682 = JCM 14932 = NBRC 107160]MDR4934416.1 hypothetical protein [Companilactobacillus paralimentarius]